MKEKLRKEIKEKRRKHSKEKNRKKSKEIKEKLLGLREYQDAKTVLFYVSYNGEVFTHDLVKDALKDKEVVVPISNPEEGTLTLSKLKSGKDLEVGSYNILEPKIACINEVSVFDIDCIIIPGVAFDSHGCRLGHGVGYYDELLDRSTNSFHIGLAFEFQIFEKIPIESQDMPVHKIITEKRVIDCLDDF